MHKLLTVVLLLSVCLPVSAQRKGKSNPYYQAWQALDKNDFKDARPLLEKAAKNPRYHDDALATLVILDNYELIDDSTAARYHNPLLTMSNPQDYFYTFWFDGAAMGTYGKMDSLHLSNADYILSHDHLFNGTLQAAAHYFKSQNEAIRGHWDAAREENAKMGSISHWAFAGPFDNTAGSGFDKNYAPIIHPRMDTTFKVFNNTLAGWFIPAHPQNDNWMVCRNVFPQTAGLFYAESFVRADRDISCTLCLGAGGSLKVWVNDKLEFAQADEKNTELDTYKVPCHLHKGYNRVLVQEGFADIEIPNFMVRFTDAAYRPVQGLVSTAQYHSYVKDTSRDIPAQIPLFAETFFKERIDKDPSNPVNYLLLAATYLRNQKYDQAQKILTGLLADHPQNAIILSRYMASVQSVSGTDVLECIEKIKTLDPEGPMSLIYKEAELEKNKKYKEAVAVLDTLEHVMGAHPEVLIKKIQAVANEGDVEKMAEMIRQGYRLYPDNKTLVLMMYNYDKKVANKPSDALEVLNEFCRRLHVPEVTTQLALEYIDQGQFEKGMDILKKVRMIEPWDADIYNTIAGEYYKQNMQDSAIACLKALSANQPYRSGPYSDIGTCYFTKGDTADAITFFKKALRCDPSLSAIRKKMRDLEKAPELTTFFPKVSEDSLIDASLKHPFDTTHHYYDIFKIHNTLVYAQGSNEQEVKTAVYINDDKGVDDFNTVYIPFNNNYQELTILKAMVIKPDGSRVPATTSDNQIVFPKIAAGDAIFYDFKLVGTGVGRMGREFWDSYYFLDDVPARLREYNLLIGTGTPLYYKCTNDSAVKPLRSAHEKYTLYSWKMKDIDALKEEPLMPPSVDVGKVLHLSTIPSWSNIADWYSDVTREQSKKSLRIDQLVQTLFPAGTAHLSDMQKAKTIYDYVVSNIAYNSVSFMHSAYVPQKADKTLSSRLGDCKDVSTLFIAIARRVGLDANLVLVNTRDNGHAMALPSMEFNHCIVRFNDKGKSYYLELTDKNLPFMALPLDLYNAQVLNIPYTNDSSAADLIVLKPQTKLPDVIHRKLTLTVSGGDLEGTSVLRVSGAQTSIYRSRFRNEDKNDIDKSVMGLLTQSFKKPVEVENVTWKGLNKLCDTVVGQVQFTVKNEIIQVGDMNIWKPDFIDLVATSNLFTVKKRRYPVEYWQYENTQQYETELEVNLPADKSFRQIPSDVTADFQQMKYRLSYKKISPTKLLIQRSFITQPWRNIPVADYAGLEDFFNKIIKAESRYISF